MFPLYDPVCVLLEKPFSRWNSDDQKDFLSCEKPMPLLYVNKVTKTKDKFYSRKFKKSWYWEFDWLCGSYYLNKLFCVPCLIVCVKSCAWNKNGFKDFGNVTRALHKHEGSSEHIRCALNFSKLRKNLSTTEDVSEEHSKLCIKHFNETVQLNRRFMQLPIRAVLYLGRQELPFCDHHDDVSSTNRGNFQELLETFISISPVDIQEHYKKIAPAFAGDFKSIQNDVIDCISKHIHEFIEAEVKHCNFFSIQVDNSTDIVQKSQCSIIIRYVVPGGKLVERFLGFYDVGPSRTDETLFNLVSNCLEKFDYKSKLVGQCFDGASVMSGQLNSFQSKIKDVAPQAVFVQSLAHRLSLVLQQSCSGIPECRIFFATISGLPPFFHHFAKRIHIADTILIKGIPTPVVAPWTSKSKILTVITNEWDSLKQLFTEIMNDPTSDQASVLQSYGFLYKFNDFEFAFLANVFNDIFELTDVLYEALQNNSFDIYFCILQIGNTQSLVNSKRNKDTFTKIFDLVASKTMVPTEYYEGSKRVALTQNQVFEKYKLLYYEILDTISQQISTRFQDVEKLHFVTLMDTSKFGSYSEIFPAEVLSSLKVCFPNIFADIQRLKNELQLIYADPQYRDMESEHFMGILTENKNIFKEAYKLFCLTMTMPSVSVAAERNFSCLERIKMYRNTMTEEGHANLSKISIEKQLLNELINAQSFYDVIIDKFANLENRKIDLTFRK